MTLTKDLQLTAVTATDAMAEGVDVNVCKEQHVRTNALAGGVDLWAALRVCTVRLLWEDPLRP